MSFIQGAMHTILVGIRHFFGALSQNNDYRVRVPGLTNSFLGLSNPSKVKSISKVPKSCRNASPLRCRTKFLDLSLRDLSLGRKSIGSLSLMRISRETPDPLLVEKRQRKYYISRNRAAIPLV
jgi:hypothetical protein